MELATLEADRVAFVEAVIRPALKAPAGRERAARLLELRIEHIEAWPPRGAAPTGKLQA